MESLQILWDKLTGYRTIGTNVIAFITLNITDISQVIAVALDINSTIVSTSIMALLNVYMRMQTKTPVFNTQN